MTVGLYIFETNATEGPVEWLEPVTDEECNILK